MQPNGLILEDFLTSAFYLLWEHNTQTHIQMPAFDHCCSLISACRPGIGNMEKEKKLIFDNPNQAE